MTASQISDMKENSTIESEIIALAWADDVSFDDIKKRHGLTEADVILLMRRSLKRRSFKLWRERVSGRKTKHRKLLQSQQRWRDDF